MQTLKKGFENGASKDEMCNLEQFKRSEKKEIKPCHWRCNRCMTLYFSMYVW